jgi:hypothetical protein
MSGSRTKKGGIASIEGVCDLVENLLGERLCLEETSGAPSSNETLEFALQLGIRTEKARSV